MLSLHINDALLVKVEVTQEELEAQRIEELARFIDGMSPHAKSKSEYSARAILEWMRQEG